MATQPKMTSSPDEQAIRAMVQDWIHHYNARNAERVAGLYSNDGRIRPMYHPTEHGPQGVRKYLQGAFQEFDPQNLQSETTDVEISQNLALASGTYTINMKTPDGQRVDDRGKWLLVVRRTGPNWKIVDHCWSTDLDVEEMMG